MEVNTIFDRITSLNINEAVEIAREIFPYEEKNGIFLPQWEYQLSLGKFYDRTRFFIVRLPNLTPIGITGCYHHFRQFRRDELWLAYFGVLPNFRSNGFGKITLSKTIEFMKIWNTNLHAIKILTSVRAEEEKSLVLYKSFGFKRYACRKDLPYDWHYYRLLVTDS